MKRYQRLISLLLVVFMLMGTLSTANATFILPASLTAVEEEAFAGDSSLQDLLTLPADTTSVGQNAFKGTGLFALDVPASVNSFAAQESLSLAYVYFRGNQTAVEGSAFSHYVFAPAGSAAAAWAANSSATFVAAASLAVSDGFYYQIDGSNAKLLCPVVASAVPATVRVPATVGQAKVTALSSNAFMGCSQVTKIILPEGVTAEDGAYSGCPNATVTVPQGTQVVLSATNVTLDADHLTYQLTAQVTGDLLPTTAVRYATLDSSVAWVDSNGIISAQNNGTTLITVTAADGTIARCRVEVDLGSYPVSFTNVPESIQAGETHSIELSIDNGRTPPATNSYCLIEFTYYDANDLPISTTKRGLELDAADSTLHFSCEYANAARIDLKILSDRWYCLTPGQNPTASINVTPVTGTPEWYSVALRYGMAYPGSYGRLFVEAIYPEALTSPRTVSVRSKDGLLNQTVGTISKDSPYLTADIQFPAQWDYSVNNDDSSYGIDVLIGDDLYYEQWVWLDGLFAPDVYIGVDQTRVRTITDYCTYPGQWPLTFAVEDDSIATISSTGSITGKKVGVTTATVTTSSGHSMSFDIIVANMEIPTGKPVLSVIASVTDIYWESSDTFGKAIAVAIPEEANELSGGSEQIYYPVDIQCYDGNDEFVGTVTYGFPAYNGSIGIYVHPSELENQLNIMPQTPEEKIHRVEVSLRNTEEYVIGEFSSASVNFHYSDSTADTDETPIYNILFNDYDYQVEPGDTVTISVECLNPEVLDEPVIILPRAPYDEIFVTDIQTATISKDNPTATVSLTLSEDALCGIWVSISVFADQKQICSDGVELDKPVPVSSQNVSVTVGSTFTLPIPLDDGMTMEDMVFVSGDPAIVTVNDSGVATAVAAGKTTISVTMADKFGVIYSQSITVQVRDVVGDAVPKLSMTADATAADYGDLVTVTLKLDGAPPKYGVETRVRIVTSLLDETMQPLGEPSYEMEDLEEAAELNGQAFPISWPISSDLTKAKYLYITLEPLENPNENAYSYCLDYDPCLIEITSVPELEEVVYTLYIYDPDQYIDPDDEVRVTVERMNMLNNYPEAFLSLKTKDGVEVCSDVVNQDSRYCSLYPQLENVSIGDTVTLYLYVNGEKTDQTVSYTVQEYSMSFYCPPRLEVGSNADIVHFGYVVDYQPTVTYTSSDPSVLAVDANGRITGLKPGIATVTATTAAGQRKEGSVIVYDPDDCVDPVFYITHTKANGGTCNWFVDPYVALGTETPLHQIKDGLTVYYDLTFLDENGTIVHRLDEEYTYFSARESKEIESIYLEKDQWIYAFENGARVMCITLREEDHYSCDDDRYQLTYALPAPDTYPEPVVKTNYRNISNNTYNVGDTLTLNFTCVNPATLSWELVGLYESRYDENGVYGTPTLVSGYLNWQTPSLTLEYVIPEKWAGKKIDLLVYDGLESYSVAITVASAE